jgi:hypothetical protein
MGGALSRLAPRMMKLRVSVALLAMLWAAPGCAAELVPVEGPGATPPPPWHFAGLPFKSKPATRFEAVEVDGARVLRIDADRSFGNLIHPLAAGTPAGTLSWRARIEQPIVGGDLTQRSGEDTALRVCATFDLPLARVPFFERQMLRLAQTRSQERLPTAMLCYVADAVLPAGTLVVSPFTRRMRSIVVAHAPPGQWTREQHDLGTDFLRAFGDEAAGVPPLTAVVVGADGDNTGSHSVALLAALHLATPP